MLRFQLNRLEDEGGVSGKGVVAEGVVFRNGKTVLSWVTEHTSVAVYDSIQTVEKIHGHNGKTLIVWLDEVPGRGASAVTATEVGRSPGAAPRRPPEKDDDCG